MSTDPSKISLYTQGTFDDVATELQQCLDTAAAIGQSGFGTVILGQYHVHPDGTIYSNDTPLDRMGGLDQVVAALKRGGTVQNVTICFGPFGSDFLNMQSNMASFQQQMDAFSSLIGTNGYDWDVEQNLDDNMVGLLADLTAWANPSGTNVVTAAPYYSVDFWNRVLAKTNGGGKSGTSWFNLQTYGGADYRAWVSGLRGVPDPSTFLVPFYKAGDMDPSDVQSAIAQCPGADAGGIWNYGLIESAGYRPSDYSKAIQGGLSQERT